MPLQFNLCRYTEEQRSFVRKLMKDILKFVHGPSDGDGPTPDPTAVGDGDANPNDVVVSVPLTEDA